MGSQTVVTVLFGARPKLSMVLAYSYLRVELCSSGGECDGLGEVWPVL